MIPHSMTIKEYFLRKETRRIKRAQKASVLWAKTGSKMSQERLGEPKTQSGDLERATPQNSSSLAWRRQKRLALNKSPIKHGLIGRKELKKQLVRDLGLLDKRINGSLCRLGLLCPDYYKIGTHNGEVAYHLVPQQRGDAARFISENVIWVCSNANYGEKMNRSLYRGKHVAIFGSQRIEWLERIAETTVHISTADLWEMKAQIARKIERGVR